MKQRVRDLVQQGDKLWADRGPLHSLWQVTAEQFWPERADFTRTFATGEEFASHLMTGAPSLMRRELANAFSSMLRPRGKPWFHARTDDERINNDAASRTFLDHKSDVLRRIMYDKDAHFVRATKEGDNFFATFGQTVILIELNRERNGLLYKNRHLRDVVWAENAELNIDTAHDRTKLQARSMKYLWPKTVHAKVEEACKDEPFKEIPTRKIVLPWDEYDLEKEKTGGRKFPFVCITVDAENEVVLEEVGQAVFPYVIPRWVTSSGSQYAHSPATVIALPDARLLQQITLTLLEAGQKAVDPPMKVVSQAIQGAANLYAGGVTGVDAEYDERNGAAIEPVWDQSPNLGWGVDREQRIADLIGRAFFLNQIQVPFMEGDMTATEYRGRVQEYIRNALPLFEPMEVEYNGAICDKSFEIALLNGAFGPMQDMPRVLRGREINWQFDSPLQDANERAKSQAYVEAANLLKIAAEIDPMAPHDFNSRKAFRDALMGTGAPAEWTVPQEEADEAREQSAQQMAAQQQAAAVAEMAAIAEQGGKAAASVGAGARELQEAGVL